MTTLKCYNCGGEGHKANDCSSPSQKKSVWCNFCESNKHSYKSCKNRISEESSDEEDCKKKAHAKMMQHNGDDEEKASDGEAHSFIFGVSRNMERNKTREKEETGLLVDSGATSHIVNDMSLFNWIDRDHKSKEHSLQLADGTEVTGTVHGKGNATMMIRDENGMARRATLSNVLYCPSFPCNIFSINAATKRHKDTMVTLGAETGTLNASGTKFPIQNRNGLYFLTPAC